MSGETNNTRGLSRSKRKSRLSRKRWFWFICLSLLILSAYIVPYVFLGDIARITASFLYWTLFAVLAIFFTIRIIKNWRD
ncbi:hypothetical protein [Halocella sp. SP3-1]|uniref:hypothetical protein n=1 Tax=Halocella sp. SP3-1 TaxID=2382161 RepID=UPI000F7634CC|nr:hypothetical protein [Halocella sp. SP3-1]AZO94657.1 hypothetical protein D7D81_08675 [Halocella sp. SP3-1]